MKLISWDPGAERMGWAYLSDKDGMKGDKPLHHESGVFSVPRGEKEQYQPYRLRLMQIVFDWADSLFQNYKPDISVNEIVPAPSGTNFGRLAQMSLATTAITVVQVAAYVNKIPVYQIAANTVKRVVGGSGDATKVAVRNGVLSHLPELKEFKMEWPADRWDAIAVGLTQLGYVTK